MKKLVISCLFFVGCSAPVSTICHTPDDHCIDVRPFIIRLGEHEEAIERLHGEKLALEQRLKTLEAEKCLHK